MASYAYLLLAGLRVDGIKDRGPAIPIPKWQKDNTLGRVSTQKRLQKLRREVEAYAIERLDGDSGDLVIDSANSTKCRELEFLLELAGIFVRAG